MIAYSRGSKRLAGAASLKHRMPALIGPFCIHWDIAQRIEQQPLRSCLLRVRFPLSNHCL
jgi:hypothetical protein